MPQTYRSEAVTLVGLPTVAVVAILAELLGNSATRPTTRGIFAVLVLLELRLAQTVGGVVFWMTNTLLNLL